MYNFDFKKPLLSRAILAGTFTGFVATIVNLVYHFIYRYATNFSPSNFINVSSIIFGTMIVTVIAGFIYYFLGERKSSTMIFLVIMAVLTIGFAFLDVTTSVNVVREWLLFGLIILTGAFTMVLVPYYVRHSQKLI